jgi:hypothetical protein
MVHGQQSDDWEWLVGGLVEVVIQSAFSDEEAFPANEITIIATDPVVSVNNTSTSKEEGKKK